MMLRVLSRPSTCALPGAFSSKIGSRFASVASASQVSWQAEGSSVGGFTLRNEFDYRVFAKDAATGSKLSPWHDIPLYVDREKAIVNYVNEIPLGATEKMEVASDEPFNPIKQDVKKEKLRLYPFASLVNYGCLPQTWEDPKHADASTGMLGDNDPVDLVEVGSRIAKCGEVYPVKMLGILGMIDEGEMDWKVIGIACDDPLADSVNNVADLDKVMPGKVESIVQWFKTYKMPDGKPENLFAFDDQARDVAFTKEIVDGTHALWANKDRLKEEGHWIE
jgi:inorganic pyrophosphatase